MRNAAAHRVILLSHRGKRSPSHVDYGAIALSRKLLEIVAESNSLRFVLTRAYERDLLQALGPAFITYATTGEKEPLEVAYKPIEERLKSTSAALRNLGWKPAP